MTTRKISQQTRYIIEKQEQDMEVFGCQHSMCERFHQKWRDRHGNCNKPIAPRPEYVLLDTVTDQRIDRYDDAFSTKREAAESLMRFLSLLTDIEWQQIAKAGA
jgi:hypothetical protein